MLTSRVSIRTERIAHLARPAHKVQTPHMQLSGNGTGPRRTGVLALVVLSLGVAGAPAAAASAVQAAPASASVAAAPAGAGSRTGLTQTLYRNPVSKPFADTY